MNLPYAYFKKVKTYTNYFSGQAKAVETMVKNKRSNYDIAFMMIAASGAGNKLVKVTAAAHFESIIDLSNTLLDHPGIDSVTHSKVSSIRLSANKKDLLKLAKLHDELLLFEKLLT